MAEREPLRPPDDPHPFDRLVKIMALLRSEGGCPWDRAQSAATLKPHVIEEAYELAEAIEEGGGTELREELGDLLFLIVFLARLAEEEGAFSAREVAETVAAKMIRRHPHVFRGASAETPADVIEHWEATKSDERRERNGSVLDGLPRNLPALQRAQRLQERAGGLGFDWASPAPVVEKLREELAELEEAARSGEPERVAEEMGDLLFTAVNLSRQLGLHAEETLRLACEKFRFRFGPVEEALRRAGGRLSLEEMDRIWEENKR